MRLLLRCPPIPSNLLVLFVIHPPVILQLKAEEKKRDNVKHKGLQRDDETSRVNLGSTKPSRDATVFSDIHVRIDHFRLPFT